MAKHYVYADDQEPGKAPDRRLEIHWHPNGSVAIGSTRWVGEGEPNTALHYLPREGSDPPQEAWEGAFTFMDRAKVNHLIKYLRVARDQAYGKDE